MIVESIIPATTLQRRQGVANSGVAIDGMGHVPLPPPHRAVNKNKRKTKLEKREREREKRGRTGKKDAPPHLQPTPSHYIFNSCFIFRVTESRRPLPSPPPPPYRATSMSGLPLRYLVKGHRSQKLASYGSENRDGKVPVS